MPQLANPTPSSPPAQTTSYMGGGQTPHPPSPDQLAWQAEQARLALRNIEYDTFDGETFDSGGFQE